MWAMLVHVLIHITQVIRILMLCASKQKLFWRKTELHQNVIYPVGDGCLPQ